VSHIKTDWGILYKNSKQHIVVHFASVTKWAKNLCCKQNYICYARHAKSRQHADKHKKFRIIQKPIVYKLCFMYHVHEQSTMEQEQTWIISITRAKITFATSVKKLTLMGLNWNFPSTFDMKTRMGCSQEVYNECTDGRDHEHRSPTYL
jgi:hypothetical protein